MQVTKYKEQSEEDRKAGKERESYKEWETLNSMVPLWKKNKNEITKEEYDRWRYYYPEYDTSGQWHKITPSQELSDMLLADLKEHTGK